MGGGVEGWLQMTTRKKGRAQMNEKRILSIWDVWPGQAEAGVWNL